MSHLEKIVAMLSEARSLGISQSQDEYLEVICDYMEEVGLKNDAECFRYWASINCEWNDESQKMIVNLRNSDHFTNVKVKETLLYSSFLLQEFYILSSHYDA